MTDADKIKYLEGWVESLAQRIQAMTLVCSVHEGRVKKLEKEYAALETELAAARAQIIDTAVDKAIKANE